MSDIKTILRVDASARHEASVSRQLSTKVVDHFAEQGGVKIQIRDLNEGLPFVNEAWITSNFTRPEKRTVEDESRLNFSDGLVAELREADILVIGTPIYNFSIPAALKAWIDMIARVGLTFRYTENGPVGLLEGKRAIILVASGGTQVGSNIDYATPYLRHALAFVGITDVTFIAADALSSQSEERLQEALRQIDNLNLYKTQN